MRVIAQDGFADSPYEGKAYYVNERYQSYCICTSDGLVMAQYKTWDAAKAAMEEMRTAYFDGVDSYQFEEDSSWTDTKRTNS